MMDRYVASEQQPGEMRSTIAWALLGLLIQRPSYGYELVQRFKRVYGETLVLSSQTRIYTALESLRMRSLIEEVNMGEPDSSATRQPRPHYRATVDGMRAYEDWLLIQLEEERQRQRLFIRQLAVLQPDAALELIECYERECLKQADDALPATSEAEDMAERLAEEDEQLTLEARLSWIRYARRELTALAQQHAEEADPANQK
jgi:DNA-binding PadR family transcriptional regulator